MPSVPRVTVGVPVYNGARFLAAALDGLLRQTYPDFRIVVGDNASTDETPRIAAGFAARDPRVRYVRHPRNLGAAGNYNFLLGAADTEYFRWAAADDVSSPAFLERCVAALDAAPAAVLAYPRTQFIDADGTVTAFYDDRLHLDQHEAADRYVALMERLERCNAIFGLVRTDALRRVRPLGAYPGSDIVLLAELSLYGQFLEVPERLFSRRFHGDASSGMTAESLAAFFRPEARRPYALREWRHLAAHLRSVLRAPLAAREKGRLVRYVLRRARWNRNALARELVRGVAAAAGRLVPRRSR